MQYCTGKSISETWGQVPSSIWPWFSTCQICHGFVHDKYSLIKSCYIFIIAGHDELYLAVLICSSAGRLCLKHMEVRSYFTRILGKKSYANDVFEIQNWLIFRQYKELDWMLSRKMLQCRTKNNMITIMNSNLLLVELSIVLYLLSGRNGKAWYLREYPVKAVHLNYCLIKNSNLY